MHLKTTVVKQYVVGLFVLIIAWNIIIIFNSDAKSKGEFSCKGDTLLEGGRKGTMHNGTSYREKRIFKTTKFKVHSRIESRLHGFEKFI